MTEATTQELAGRTALVSGGSSDIGAAIVRSLARRGADVVIHYHRNAVRAAEVANGVRALGRRAWTIQADLSVAAESFNGLTLPCRLPVWSSQVKRPRAQSSQSRFHTILDCYDRYITTSLTNGLSVLLTWLMTARVTHFGRRRRSARAHSAKPRDLSALSEQVNALPSRRVPCVRRWQCEQ